MNGVIYCRVSSKEQLEGTSLQSQEIACREYARTHQFTILKVFVEKGESAKFADRTELLELIDFCRVHKGEVDALLVWKLDRFARNVEDHYHLKAMLAKYGVRIVSVTEPIDPNPNGKLLETILAGFAQFDNEIRAMRTVQGMRRKIQEGLYPWKPPFGYLNATAPGEKKTQPDYPEQPLFNFLQQAWRLFATGAYTKAEIRRLLTNWGVVTRRGQPLSPQSVDNLFINPYYAGILVDPWSGEEFEGQHAPMVTREEFARVQHVLRRSHQAVPHKKTRADFPLRGVVRCNDCQHYLTGSFSRGRSGRYPYYYCSQRPCGSRKKSCPTRVIHEELESFLNSVVVDPELPWALGDLVLEAAEERRAFLKSKMAHREAGLTRVKRETQELIRMRAQNLITDQEFLAQKAAQGERRMALERASVADTLNPERVREHLTEITAPFAALRETWRAFPETLQGRFVRCLLPVGFVAGEIRTAERALLLKVFGALREEQSTLVALVRKNPNRIWEEITGFASLLREAQEVYGGSAGSVRKDSRD